MLYFNSVTCVKKAKFLYFVCLSLYVCFLLFDNFTEMFNTKFVFIWLMLQYFPKFQFFKKFSISLIILKLQSSTYICNIFSYVYVWCRVLSRVQVRNAFVVMDLVVEQIMEIMSVLSAILHLGNISFVSAAGMYTCSTSHLPFKHSITATIVYLISFYLLREFV